MHFHLLAAKPSCQAIIVVYDVFGTRKVSMVSAKWSEECLSFPRLKRSCNVWQAEDDPIAVEPAIPYEALAQNPNCTLVTTPGGGHLGWAAGNEGPFGRVSCSDELHPPVIAALGF